MSRLSNLLRQVETQDPSACRRPEAGSGRTVRAARVRAQLRASHPRDSRTATPASAPGGQGPVPAEARREGEQRRPLACGGLTRFAVPAKGRVADLVRQQDPGG